MNKQRLTVYIGRFQPLHLAHEYILNKAHKDADKVLCIVGSAFSPRTVKDPFTFVERRQMILSVSPDTIVKPIKDFTYDDPSWIQTIEDIVRDVSDTMENCEISFIGHDKDFSSSYLDYFPQWKNINVDEFTLNNKAIHATTVREQLFNYFFKNNTYHDSNSLVSITVFKYLHKFSLTNEFNELEKDCVYYSEYKNQYGKGPFVTVDSLVIQSGHIALIKRGVQEGKHTPGRGLYALPGGFLEPDEPIQNASLRELREETKLKVPDNVLNGALVHEEFFSGIHRSLRGRIITHVFMYKLKDSEKLPKLKGSDDAEWAGWVSFGDFEKLQSEFFEDHFFIISRLLNVLGNKKSKNINR